MSESAFRLMFSALVCGPAALLAAGYLLREWLGAAGAEPEGGSAGDAGAGTSDSGAASGRAHRRRLGAALVLMVSVVFFMGTNYLDPERDSVGYLAIWLLVMVQLAWLVWLAVQDLRQTMQEHQLRRDNLRKDAQSWQQRRNR